MQPHRLLNYKRFEQNVEKKEDISPLTICREQGGYVSTDGVIKTRIVYHDYNSAFESCQIEGRR